MVPLSNLARPSLAIVGSVAEANLKIESLQQQIKALSQQPDKGGGQRVSKWFKR